MTFLALLIRLTTLRILCFAYLLLFVCVFVSVDVAGLHACTHSGTRVHACMLSGDKNRVGFTLVTFCSSLGCGTEDYDDEKLERKELTEEEEEEEGANQD